MVRRKIKTVRFGRCSVSIYKISEVGEYNVQATVDGKVIGGRDGGGAFETDKASARSTAAAMVYELRRKNAACRGRV